MLGLVDGRDRSRRASFFDVLWNELTLEVNLIVDPIPMPEFSDVCEAPWSFPGLPCDSSCRLFFTDSSVDLVEERASCGFYVPRSNYRFGAWLPDASSVLFTELYAIFFAVKYILRMGFEDSPILSDSRVVLVCIRDRLIVSSVPYIVHFIARLLSLASSRGLGVRFVWVPAHSDIQGNETADYIAKSAARLPFSIRPVFPFRDLLTDLQQNFLAWYCLRWPYHGPGHAGSACFARVSFKNFRPWFRGFRVPRSHATRLRKEHICTGEHFARMHWHLEADCGCSAELRSLQHIFLISPLLSEGRSKFFGFLARRFPGLPPDQFDYRELVLDPDPSVVSELGRFYRLGYLIRFFGILSGEGCSL